MALRFSFSMAILMGLLMASASNVLADDPTIAPQATLIVWPNHGPCDQEVQFTGTGFVPGTSVILRPISAGRGQPYPDSPTYYEVTPDNMGAFTLFALPCPENAITGNRTPIIWSAEPPGRPYFIPDQPFGSANFSIFDPDTSRFFPETNYSVSGEFLYVWEQAGGMRVFGYPLSGPTTEQTPDTGEELTVQYFERSRIELHPEHQGTVYAVQVGRLGVQILESQGRDWTTFSQADSSQPFYFPETGHAIAPEFQSFWGLGLDLGDPEFFSLRESIALYGFPISESMTETNADGDTILTQYFERAIFEFHPDNTDRWRVLLRRVGAELYLHPAIQ